jgi:hypothetical protein
MGQHFHTSDQETNQAANPLKQHQNLKRGGMRAICAESRRLARPSTLGWIGATDENIEEIASLRFLQQFIENPNIQVGCS